MQVREEDFVSRLFVASTHAPILYFSSRGKVYKEKVWRLPIAAPQARGKALINILPLQQGETITTIMTHVIAFRLKSLSGSAGVPLSCGTVARCQETRVKLHCFVLGWKPHWRSPLMGRLASVTVI